MKEKLIYETPEIDVLELLIEKGYAISGGDLNDGGPLSAPTNWD